ncbi:DUF4232 domain-containing protein [Streptomyces sp. NBC_01216]|uniref:DUF4232 domain-containing protein n=1 Tax=unclassified Streptomyces TaxID=2593676 RepID=UPI002E161E90|nr:DUF4232 domain-containing protein [Streptomyces sp. NBC_01216]
MSTVRRAAALLVAVSALVLTACGPGDDGAAGGQERPPVTPSTPTASAAPTKAPPSATPDEGASGGGGSPAGPSGVHPCGTADVTFTATLAEPTTSSYLLTITNRGTRPCKALGHPVVTFGDLDGQATERGTAPGPADALTLAPGRSAYAGLMGGLDDGRGRTVDSIAMTMYTASDLEQSPLAVSTPGLHVSPDRNSVTVWTDNAEDALSL